jgi:hypothetical protein
MSPETRKVRESTEIIFFKNMRLALQSEDDLSISGKG